MVSFDSSCQGYHSLQAYLVQVHSPLKVCVYTEFFHVDFLPCVQVLQTEVAYWAVDTQELSAHEQSFPTFRAFPDDSSIHFYGLRAHEHPGLCKVWCLEALLSPFTSSLTVEMCSHGKNQ